MNFMNKDYIKEIWATAKPKLIVLLCLVCSFVSGFAAGKGESQLSKPAPRQLQYTTNKAGETKAAAPQPTNLTPAHANTNSTVTATADCYIKGSKSRIYHMPGGSFYDRTNPVQCFASEAEAQAAGFTKSSR